MGETAMSPPSIDPATSKVVSISTQIMIGAVIVLFFVVAFCFFLHLYARCYWSNMNEDRNVLSWRRRMAHQRRHQSSVPAHRRGLDPTALRSLPVVVYNPKDFKEGLECAVCLSEVSEGEKARFLPKCNHGFHVQCIDMWFQSHSTCPLCRNPVISTENQAIDEDTNTHNTAEVQQENGVYSSESDNSDDDNDDTNGSFDSSRTRESPLFPTNILIWGDETQVSSFGQAANTAASSSSASSSSVISRPRNDEMVIEIPSRHELCDDCVSSPPLEEAKTPVVTRLASLKRLLSLGKRVVSPSPRAASSSSCDVVHQQV